jgi:tight adherence protein B
VSAAAVALALALLVVPTSARHRLRPIDPQSGVRQPVLMLCGLGAAALVIVAFAPVTVILAAAVVVATIAARRRRRAGRRRRNREAAALQGALDVLVGELRVGAHPIAAFDVAAREVDGAVAESLSAVAARARMGADVAAGLRREARRSTLPGHWENLAVCWRLAESQGLGIAALMHTAHRDIVERERFTTRVNAGMAGARATAGVLTGLRVVGIGLGQLIGADPLAFLLGGGAGGWLLVAGAVLVCSGLLWAGHITDGVLT